MEKLTGHLVLFAKRHYKRTDDIVDDLKTLMSNWSGCSKEFYTDHYIYDIVVGAFVESCSKRDIEKMLKGIYIPINVFSLKNDTLTVSDAISHMIGLMSIIQIKEQDDNGQWQTLIDLPEPDPKYLPVSTEE